MHTLSSGDQHCSWFSAAAQTETPSPPQNPIEKRFVILLSGATSLPFCFLFTQMDQEAPVN